jgi:hypothetical protein
MNGAYASVDRAWPAVGCAICGSQPPDLGSTPPLVRLTLEFGLVLLSQHSEYLVHFSLL